MHEHTHTCITLTSLIVVLQLQEDIGAVMWKGKRMKTYRIKPIDKIVPRRCYEAGAGAVMIVHKPVFFRAPMLQSKIHRKFDAEFCKSTDLQLKAVGLEWERLWLTEEEEAKVRRFRETGRWGDDDDEEGGLRRDDVEEETQRAKGERKGKSSGGGRGTGNGGGGGGEVVSRGMLVVVGLAVVIGIVLLRRNKCKKS